MVLRLIFTALFVYATGVVAEGLCPIYGPVFPVPKNLSSSSTAQKIFETLKITLDDAFANKSSPYGPVEPNDAYSIQIFSIADDKLPFEYHHHGGSLTEGLGASVIDGDAVYRVGSTSKLYAVYMLLIEAGVEIFSDPVSKHLPELEEDEVWESITVGALAGQVAGIPADLYDISPLAGGNLSTFYPGVFPELLPNETEPCITNVTTCTREEFFASMARRRFTYAPFTTPAYSNSAFVILGYVLESLTGVPWEESLKTLLTSPLNLTRTFATTPPTPSIGVLMRDESFSGWNTNISSATAMGGIFSSSSDLSTLGLSILSSLFLPKPSTRSWLSPTSFTSSLIGAVGRPWEIYRASIDETNNRVVDIYAKGGNIGIYDSNLALFPDYGLGFTILQASEYNNRTYGVSGLVTEALIAAAEEVAREQAHEKFAGTYVATNGVNSSVSITTTRGKPGLEIQSWISNGTDMMAIFNTKPGVFRAYPSNRDETGTPSNPEVDPVAKGKGEGSVSSWKASGGIDFGFERKGPFSACITWLAVDRPGWGIWGIDDFLFHLDGEGGAATGLEIKALKIVLERQ